MTQQDRENLALAYAHAWRAVKGERCEVTVEKSGWFTRVLYSGFSTPHANSMRASALINGLLTLNARISNGDVHHSIIKAKGV
jgi:hypothetical protein